MWNQGFSVRSVPKVMTPPKLVKRCQTAGCNEVTRWNKPFCTEHVTSNPHAARVTEELEAHLREIEVVRAYGSRAVHTRGLMARELLRQLVLYGDRTVERLARDLGYDPDVVHAVARALAREGTVSIGRTARGSTLLHLIPDALDVRSAGARPPDTDRKAG